MLKWIIRLDKVRKEFNIRITVITPITIGNDNNKLILITKYNVLYYKM